MSKRIKLEILEAGDSVIGFSENRIAVKKKGGDVEVFTLSFDNENVPRIGEVIVVICRRKSAGKKVSILTKDKTVEIGSF